MLGIGQQLLEVGAGLAVDAATQPLSNLLVELLEDVGRAVRRHGGEQRTGALVRQQRHGFGGGGEFGLVEHLDGALER